MPQSNDQLCWPAAAATALACNQVIAQAARQSFEGWGSHGDCDCSAHNGCRTQACTMAAKRRNRVERDRPERDCARSGSARASGRCSDCATQLRNAIAPSAPGSCGTRASGYTSDWATVQQRGIRVAAQRDPAERLRRTQSLRMTQSLANPTALGSCCANEGNANAKRARAAGRCDSRRPPPKTEDCTVQASGQLLNYCTQWLHNACQRSEERGGGEAGHRSAIVDPRETPTPTHKAAHRAQTSCAQDAVCGR